MNAASGYCTFVPAIAAPDRTEWTRLASERLAGVELLAARFVRHTYARHAHDAYVLAVIDAGTQTFRYRGAQRVATAGDIVVLQPGEAHDGRPLGGDGYAYRTLHISPTHLAEQEDKNSLPIFREPILRDAKLRALVNMLCERLETTDVPAEACREALFLTTEALKERYGQAVTLTGTSDRPADRALAERAREFMEEHVSDSMLTIERLAAKCSTSRSHLTRAFSARFGIPPHAWLIQRRLFRARSRLLAGEPAALVAIEAGFTDQSHFVKRFKAVYGVPPGLWARRA